MLWNSSVAEVMEGEFIPRKRTFNCHILKCVQYNFGHPDSNKV